MPRILMIAVLVALLGGGSLSAAEIVLAPGDDLDAALEDVAAGDVVILRDGEWRDCVLRLEAEGTAEHPVVLRAKTPGKAILTGSSRLQFSGRHITVSGLVFRDVTTAADIIEFRTHPRRLAEHCRLSGCVIVNQVAQPLTDENRWVSIYGTSNRVDHCYFAGKRSVGSMLVVWVTDQPNHHQIDHNHFGHRPPLGRNGGETIRVGTSAVSMQDSRTLVEHNLFERCDGEVEIISSKSCENVYRDNTFRRCSGALTLRHGNRCRVEGNIFLGEGARGTGGVRIIGEDHVVVNNYFADLAGDGSRSAISMMNGLVDSPLHGYFQVKNAVVAFNTIVDCKVALEIGVEASARQPLAPTNCIFASNVLIGRRNEIRRNAEPIDWQEEGTIRGASADDLQFFRTDDGIWRPTPASPVIGAADALWARIDRDIDGAPRTQPFDAGCDQQATASRPPLRPVDVGPEWLPAEQRQSAPSP